MLDKLVGYRGSPLLWQLQNGAKSMGRVQSAALHILCTREREIQAFVPQDYWSVFVDYAEGFRAYYRGTAAETSEEEAPDDAASPSEQSAPESARVTSEADANHLVAIAQQHPHTITGIEGKTTSRKPPPPFITSSLQQTAGSRLRFSPEQTMKVAQSLYEAGLITYMRTDSTMLSPEFCAQARQWLETHDPDNVPKKVAQHRKAKGAQEAHEAIRPTDMDRASEHLRAELSTDAFNLYVMIWKRAIASQCKPAQVQQTNINTQSGSVCWQTKGQVVIFLGYTRYWKNLKADAELPSRAAGAVGYAPASSARTETDSATAPVQRTQARAGNGAQRYRQAQYLCADYPNAQAAAICGGYQRLSFPDCTGIRGRCFPQGGAA